MSFNLANWRNVFRIYLVLGSTSIGHARTRLKYGTITVTGFSQKLPFSVGKFFYSKTNLEVQYTIPLRHITNISDFVWFQRSCGSMKSVSSFSSIEDIHATLHKCCKHFFLSCVNAALPISLSSHINNSIVILLHDHAKK